MGTLGRKGLNEFKLMILSDNRKIFRKIIRSKLLLIRINLLLSMENEHTTSKELM